MDNSPIVLVWMWEVNLNFHINGVELAGMQVEIDEINGSET